MFKIFLSLFLILFFSGCLETVKPPVKANEKVFAEEDMYILFALRAEQVKDYASASNIFNALWIKSNKKEYLYKSLHNDLALHKNKQVISRIDEVAQSGTYDYKLIRLKIVALIGDEKFEDARVLAVELVERSKQVSDYILVSEIYVKQKKFDTALKYLESAYIQDYNEKILDRMSIILYVNLERKAEAIAQLESHSRIHGCSRMICTRLIGFYSNEDNVEGLVSVYLRFYELKKSDVIAKKIIQIYVYQKEYFKLMSFLEKSESDDELLFQIYINSKNYNKASLLAKKLYTDTGDINRLGQSAIFEYESATNKANKQMQTRVIKILKEVISVEKAPLYLNYLGYLLIDHSIDVEEGMRYVREALEIDPDSIFYLDSLAWGYYKLGECEKAFEIISRVQNLDGGDDPEVVEHVKAIERCKNKTVKDIK